MTRSNNLRAAIAAVLALTAAPSFADDAALQKEVDALRAAMAEQRAQLDAQAKLLEAQQAQLEALTKKLGQPQVATAETPKEAPKVATQEAPRVSFTNNRPTITAADGHSSIAVRANVQLDGALYGESPAGPLTTDFRRGSVGAPPNREINGARDFNDGFVFRRARFGVEGAIARDFNYRLLIELGGSATESTKINDAWIAYTGFAPFTLQLGAFAPPANMDDSTSAEDLAFLERAASAEMARSLAGADGRIGLGVKASGERYMSALTFTTRTANDAEVFDTQLAAVGRAGFLVATSDDYNVHLGANGTYVFQFADQGPGTSPRYPVRLRERPEMRVDGTRLIDIGSIDADHASIYGVEFGGNWKNFYAQGEHFWYDIARRGSTLDDPDFAGYYLQGSWIFTGERRRYNPATGTFQNPRPAHPFSGDGGLGAFELAARYSRLNLNFEEGIEGTAAAAGSIRGGDQSVVTLGINWYPNPNVKVMLDYLLIDVDRLNPAGVDNPLPFGPAPNTPPIGVQIGQDLDVIALRSQFSF
jgi:phosphate-selective porin OprO/OprP